MSKEAMKLALEAHHKNERHNSVAETNYWCNQYKLLAHQAIEALAKQEQGEPVAIVHRNEYNEYRLEPHDSFDIKSIPFNVDVPLYTTPQQRTWVGLTRKEVYDLYDSDYAIFYQRIEAKLKEKNT
jgi:hypothetical protein